MHTAERAKPICAIAIYSQRAEESGLPNMARLFRAIAYAERVHASNHYKIVLTKGDAVTVSMAEGVRGRGQL